MKEIIKKIILYMGEYYSKIKLYLNNLRNEKKMNLLDKFFNVIVKFYYIILLISLISLVYFIITSSLTWGKIILSIIVIILLVILRYSRFYIKNVMKDIDKFIDNEKSKKDLIFFVICQLLISLILTNIGLLVFFWLYCYILNIDDFLEMRENLIIFLYNIGMLKDRKIYIRICIFLITIVLFYILRSEYLKKNVYYSKIKRTKEEIEEDRIIILLAKKYQSKFYRFLTKNLYWYAFIFYFSMIFMMMKDFKILVIIGFISFLICLILYFYILITKWYFNYKVKEYLWYKCYKPNPGGNEEEYQKKYNRYKLKVRRLVDNNFQRKKTLILGGLSIIAFWTTIVTGQYTWDFFFDSEKRMYPPKKITRAIGNKIIEYTNWPEDVQSKKKADD